MFGAAVAPGGPWAWIILEALSFVENYGWRVVLFTILLKLVLSPLDIYQRYKARQNQKISLKIKPDMEKLQKIYGHDPKLLSQKQMELNKKSGISMFSSCLPSLVTLAIFITLLYFGLQPISEYKNFHEYELLYDRYHSVYDTLYEEEYAKLDTPEVRAAYKAELDLTAIENKVKEDFSNKLYKDAYDKAKEEGKTDAEAVELGEAARATIDYPENVTAIEALVTEAVDKAVEEKLRLNAGKDEFKALAQADVKDYYEEEVKTSFLWIKNIWSPDVWWKAPVNDFATFKNNVRDYATDWKKAGVESEEALKAMLSEYETVMGSLLSDSDYNSRNGFAILPALTILMSILMQFVSFRQQKQSGQTNAQSEMQMKIMMLMMPIMMGFFSLSYTAAFSIYLVMNYCGSLLIAGISALIIKVIDVKAERNQVTQVQKYGRPDFSDRNKDQK